MQFYRLTYQFDEPIKNVNTDSCRPEIADRISEVCGHYNASSDLQFYVSWSDSKEIQAVGVITKLSKMQNLGKCFEDALRPLDLPGKTTYCREIMMGEFVRDLERSSRRDFIEDDDDVLRSLGLGAITRGSSLWGGVQEAIAEKQYDRPAAEQAARDMLCEASFLPEIERIFSGSMSFGFRGHPVHYVVAADDAANAKSMAELLIGSLLQAGRLCSKRLCELEFSADGNCNLEKVRDFYKAMTGGTVLMSLVDNENDSPFADANGKSVDEVMEIVRQYRRDVLTIIVLPRNSEKLIRHIKQALHGIALVQLGEETVLLPDAERYLQRRAKADEIDEDVSFTECLSKHGESFIRSELDDMYDHWYDGYLRTQAYGQYAELYAAEKDSFAKPIGCAIEELNEMIGLQDAKQVINDAIAFHKAQKLFADKGYFDERPAMHMMFTGNPGTAKTTVARLFARIMKDNELLPVGRLIEVGRADLVGKYVGWTAQIVKEKFEKAKGSVLFIDEAYSLTDGKRGLYGEEAINTIVQEMENHRDDTVVIFAGYPDKMEEFMEQNPGLRSRIGFHVHFPDYSEDELMQIFTQMLGTVKREADAETLDKVRGILSQGRRQTDFGNGRFVRNLLEKAELRQASRLMHMDVDSITEGMAKSLLAEDFQTPLLAAREPLRVIGF